MNPPALFILTRRTGFTLVEMLAATFLGSLLILAMLMVFPSIARARKAVAATGSQADRMEPVVDLIRWDLEHAERLRVERNGFSLTGFGSLDATTRRPTHRPVRVTYRVLSGDRAKSLIREQVSLDVQNNQNLWRQEVEAGIDDIHCTPLPMPTSGPASRADPSTQPSLPRLFAETDGTPLPPAVELVLRTSTTGIRRTTIRVR